MEATSTRTFDPDASSVRCVGRRIFVQSETNRSIPLPWGATTTPCSTCSQRSRCWLPQRGEGGYCNRSWRHPLPYRTSSHRVASSMAHPPMGAKPSYALQPYKSTNLTNNCNIIIQPYKFHSINTTMSGYPCNKIPLYNIATK